MEKSIAKNVETCLLYFIVSVLYLSFPIISFLSLLFSSVAPYICSRRRNEPSCRRGNNQLCEMCISSGISLSHCKLSVLSFLPTAFIFAFIFISIVIFFFIFFRHKSVSLQTVCFVFAVLSFYLTAAASFRNMQTSLC